MNKMRRRMEGNKINWFGDRVCLRLPARVLARQTIVQRDFATIMPFAASTIVCTRQTEKSISSRVQFVRCGDGRPLSSLFIVCASVHSHIMANVHCYHRVDVDVGIRERTLTHSLSECPRLSVCT